MSKSSSSEKLHDAGRAAHRAREEAARAVSDLGAAGREVIHEAREKLEDGVDDVRDTIHRAESDFRRRYDDATSKVAHRLGSARKTMSSLTGDARQYLHDNAETAVLIAAVVGFACGVLAGSRRFRTAAGPSEVRGSRCSRDSADQLSH